MGSVRCKYGRKYFEKMEKAEAVSGQKSEDGPSYKWEKLVMQGGLAWKLLWVSSRGKKALRKGKITERELLAPLDEDEQERLKELLEKLSDTLG